MSLTPLLVHLLGYNLIRAGMGEAAKPEGIAVRCLSFAAARRATVLFQQTLRHDHRHHHRVSARCLMLMTIAYWRIPDRPDRIEPHAVKRRPKPQPLLSVTRAIAREQLHAQRKVA